MKLKKLLAASTALLMGALGFAAVPAFATEPTPGSIDKNATGSVTLHKYANPGLAEANKANPDGSDAVKFESLTAVQNVKFTVTKVDNVDLTTQAGWESLKNMNVDTAKNQLSGTKYEIITDVNGVAKQENLPLGLYLVQETDFSQAVPQVATAASDFLVSIPLNNKEKGWLYDVHVYPKNDLQTGKASKTLTGDKAYAQGDVVPWHFNLPVNGPATGKVWNNFGAWDALPDYLTFQNVTNAKFVSAAGVEQTITVTCEPTADTWAAVTYAHKLYKCLVAEADLTKLKNAGNVQFDLNAQLSKALPDSNKIEQAFKAINDEKETGDPDTPPTPPVPDDKPENPEKTSYSGDLEFEKVDADLKTAPVPNAKFTVNALGTDGTCTTPGAAVSAEATSDADGKVKIQDIPVAIAEYGLAEDAVKALSKEYCLVETEAPLGYQKANPVKVKISAGTTVNATGLMDNKFENTKGGSSIIPGLPLTGAAGSVILTLAGIALLAVAVGFGIRTARKNG